MDIPDGDLVRLARDGDPAAFRLLVERYQPMARARAARLCPRPDDVDDAVQDTFLQAFISLDGLRDPDRFAAWLGGIVVNVCRAQLRRAPLTLLADWPESLHPASADRPPSAEDLDRADVPASQIPGSAGAAKVSLHKARRRLRDYITAHRPDLIPATSRRTTVTPVRIAHADPWPGRKPSGGMSVHHVLVVLAAKVPAKDGPASGDGRHWALPIRLPASDGAFWRLLARPEDLDPAEREEHEEHPEEMTGRLLRAAGITVTGVTVTDLGPGVTATRVGIRTPQAAREVTTRLADGLALAVITGAPLAVDDAVMDRLAEPVDGPDLLTPFRSRDQAPPAAPRHRRFEPRNLAFTYGLLGWELNGPFLRQVTGSHENDYSCTAQDGRAILAAAVPEPAGFALLAQRIFADDYRGGTVTFRGELRATGVADRAGLVVRVAGGGPPVPPRPMSHPTAGQDHWHDPANHFAPAVTGTRDWARHEVTVPIPPDAASVIFGVFLNGRGQVELRNATLEH